MRIITARVEKNRPYSDDILIIQGEYHVYKIPGKRLQEFLIDNGQMCGDCLDSGEITTLERVWAGEPHMADIGSRPCKHPGLKANED